MSVCPSVCPWVPVKYASDSIIKTIPMGISQPSFLTICPGRNQHLFRVMWHSFWNRACSSINAEACYPHQLLAQWQSLAHQWDSLSPSPISLSPVCVCCGNPFFTYSFSTQKINIVNKIQISLTFPWYQA